METFVERHAVCGIKFCVLGNIAYICSPFRAVYFIGAMAEWLGNGLQNHVQQFDSAWHLSRNSCFTV